MWCYSCRGTWITRLVTLRAATDPDAPVTTTIDGFFIGLARRSPQPA